MHKKKGVVKRTKLATGIYNERKVYDVVVSNLKKDVSQRGTSMYVFNCDIILAKSKDEKVVDRRVVYKAGETQMNEVRDALINFVATKLAEEGTEIPYVTEDVLLETVRNTEVNLKADVYRSGQGNLIISLLY